MFKLNPESFRFRIAVSYFAMGLVILFFIASSFVILKTLTTSAENIYSGNALTRAAYDLTNDISKANVAIGRFLSYQRPHDRQEWDSLVQSINKSLAAFDSLANPVQPVIAEKVAANAMELLQEQENIERLVSTTNLATASTVFEAEADTFPADTGNIAISDPLVFGQVNEASPANDLAPAIDQYNSVQSVLTGKIFSDMSGLMSLIRQNEAHAAMSCRDNFAKLRRLAIATLLIMMVLFITAYRKAGAAMQKSIERARNPLRKLSAGDLPENQHPGNDEISEIVSEINTLTNNISKIKDFALEVGAGRYDSEISVFNNEGEIGKSLSEMRSSLKQIASDEKIRNWMNEGFTNFAEILRKNGENLKQLSKNVVSQMVRYLKANQGGIFILNNTKKDDTFLEMTACYAYERDKFLKKEIKPGEGLVGQCFLEKQSIYLIDIPRNYVNITSGLGGATPGNLFIAPLKFKDEVFGVIEIASFKRFERHEMEFVERVAESIASAISTVKANEHTSALLEESQMVTEQLKAQEEEMRQNLEELAATQEEMARNQKSVFENEQKTRLIYLNAFDAIITLNDQGVVDLFNPAAERIFGYAADEIRGRSISALLPDEIAPRHDQLMKAYEQPEQKKVIGVSRIVEAKRKNGKRFQIHLKVEEGMVGDEKIFLAFIEDLSEGFNKTRETEKAVERQAGLLAGEQEVSSLLSENETRLKKLAEEEIFMIKRAGQRKR